MKERILQAEHLEQFKAYLWQEEKASMTIEKYLRDSIKFLQFVEGKMMTKELVVKYKQFLLEKEYAASSVNSMLTSVNRLLEYLGWGDCKVKILRCQRQIYCPEEKELSKQEYLCLLQAAQKQPRLYHIIQTICGTGIRISELQYFTVDAIKRGTVIVSCKNKTRTIFIPGKLKKQLLAYAKKQKIKEGILFRTRTGKPMDRSNIWAQMKKLGKEAGVALTKIFPHNLRKLFARTFYKCEKDIAKLADILGHSSIETTRIYIVSTGHEHRQMIEKMRLIL